MSGDEMNPLASLEPVPGVAKPDPILVADSVTRRLAW